MEKIKDIIETKYWWDSQMRLVLLWADMATEEGTDKLQISGYLMEQVMGYRRTK